jgi:hypothetical protein
MTTKLLYVFLGLLTAQLACSTCDKQQLSAAVSPLGEEAHVLSVDCGATTDFATNVEVGQGFRKIDIIALRGKNVPSVRWADNGHTLIVSIPSSIEERDIFSKGKKTRYANVIIERARSGGDQ